MNHKGRISDSIFFLTSIGYIGTSGHPNFTISAPPPQDPQFHFRMLGIKFPSRPISSRIVQNRKWKTITRVRKNNNKEIKKNHNKNGYQHTQNIPLRILISFTYQCWTMWFTWLYTFCMQLSHVAYPTTIMKRSCTENGWTNHH